jgi:hypothetical protein
MESEFGWSLRGLTSSTVDKEESSELSLLDKFDFDSRKGRKWKAERLQRVERRWKIEITKKKKTDLGKNNPL